VEARMAEAQAAGARLLVLLISDGPRV